MRSVTRLVVVATAVLAVAAAAQDKLELNTITKVQVSGGTITIVGSKKPNFTTFTMTDPARLVIDISEAVFSGVQDEQQVGNGVVTAIKTASYGSDASAIARVLIGFDKEFETDIQTSDTKLVVKVLGAGAASEPVAVAQADKQATAQPAGPTAAEKAAAEKAAAEQAAAEKAAADKAAKEQAVADKAAAAQKAKEEALAKKEAERLAKEQAEAERKAAAEQKRQEAEAAKQAAAEEKKRKAEEAEAAAFARKQEQEAARQAALDEKKRKAEEAAAAREAAKQEQEASRQATAEEKKLKAEEAAAAREAARQEQEAARQAAAEEKKRKAEEAAAAREAARQEQEAARQASAEEKKRKAEEAAAAREAARQEREAARQEAEAARDQQRVAMAETRSQGGQMESAGSLSVSNRRKTMTFVGLKQDPGAQRVYVRTNEPVRYSLSRGGDKEVVLELENTGIALTNNTRSLDASFFNGAVAMVQPRRGPTRTVRIEIKLKENVPYEARQEGNEVYVDFQTGGRQ